MLYWRSRLGEKFGKQYEQAGLGSEFSTGDGQALLTGVAATLSQGTATANSSTGSSTTLTGQSIGLFTNDFQSVSTSGTLPGIQITFSAGQALATGELDALAGATGNAITLSVGVLTATGGTETQATITGNGIALGLGNIGANSDNDAIRTLSANVITMGLGAVAAGSAPTGTLTGNQIQLSAGTVTATLLGNVPVDRIRMRLIHKRIHIRLV